MNYHSILTLGVIVRSAIVCCLLNSKSMIITFAGRRIDADNSERPVFPLALTSAVKAKIIQALRDTDAKHVISSGACGTDLLAMQAAETLQISKTMVLPFKTETFKVTSVIDRPGDWGFIFDNLVKELRQSGQLIELDLDKNDPEVYTKTNLHILDEAEKLAARDPQDSVTAIIVWEGKPKSSGDTTHHFMLEAQKRNFVVREIRSND